MTTPQNDDETRAVPILINGTRINQYEIKHKIGAGGMGEVYLAEDGRLDRKVALKFLPSQFNQNEELRSRFTREAKTAAQLNHQNVITIYEIGEHEGRLFIAMEYIDGDLLQDIISRKQLSFEESIKVIMQVCEGLQAIHNLGMVHRDIKPSNIMIDKSKRVRVLDFGLAKLQGDDNLTQDGTAIGTVHYMSPEQSEGKELDKRSDIFSLGIVMFELLSNEKPFEKPNIPATLFSIVNDPHPDICGINSDLPQEIKLILDKALAKAPEDRYAKFQEMIDTLEQFVMSGTGTFQVPAVAAKPLVRSLAVLYLRNIGPADDEFLAYGITEDLIVDLTRIGSVRVAPMRSVMKYKDSHEELESIASQLNVDLILDGSIMKMNDMIRVSAQLVDVKSGDSLWADRWEQPFDKLPEIKQNLADGINETLQVGKTIIAAAQVGTPDAEDAEAYEYYLRGKYTYQERKERADIDIALGLYRQALKQEPTLLAAKAGIAEILMQLHDYTQAEMELKHALEEAVELKLLADQKNILSLLARYYVRQSNWGTAWEYSDKALQITVELKDSAGEAEILGIQISILQPQSKFDEALVLFDRVLDINRTIDDKEAIAEALKNMGVAYSRKGDYDRAEDLYEESLELATTQNNYPLQAACQSNIGNLYYYRGKLDKTLEYYNKSLVIYDRLGDRAGVARQKLNMGLIEIHRGNNIEGLALLTTSSEIFKQLGDRSTYALNLINISQIQLALGNDEKSLAAAEEAKEIADDIHHPLSATNANYRIGMGYFYQRKIEKARMYFTNALTIAMEANATRNMIYCHLALSKVSWYVKEFKESQHQAKTALSLAKEIGENNSKTTANALLAALSIHDGLYNSGIRQLREIVSKHKDNQNHELVLIVSLLMAEMLILFGKDKDERSEGRQLLEDCKTLAADKQLAFEKKYAIELLESL